MTRHDCDVCVLPKQEWTPTTGAHSAKDTWQMQSLCEGLVVIVGLHCSYGSQHCKLRSSGVQISRQPVLGRKPGGRAAGVCVRLCVAVHPIIYGRVWTVVWNTLIPNVTVS